MAGRINEVHIDQLNYLNGNDLGLNIMTSEIGRRISHETNEYIYRQMVEVNIDPDTIILHQKRISELENENEALKEKLLIYEKKIDAIANLIYQEGR